MSINYNKVHYLTSAVKPVGFPSDEGREVAFAGRSNTGKSSVINTICRQKSLARISKTPGRTQMINFFTITPLLRLVDLPGYGYAKVPETQRLAWRNLLENYFHDRQSLQGIVLVTDIRRGLSDYDQQMLEYCKTLGTPAHVLLNKCDKLKRGAITASQREVSIQLRDYTASLQTFSALKRIGLDEVELIITKWLTT